MLHGGPQNDCLCCHTTNLWVWTYLEKSVFANVIKLKVSKLDYPGLLGSSKSNKCPCNRRKRQTRRRRMWRQRKGLGWCTHKLSHLRAFWGVLPGQHLNFRLMVSKLWENTFLSAVLSHYICGNLLWQPQETNPHVVWAENNMPQKTNDPLWVALHAGQPGRQQDFGSVHFSCSLGKGEL